MSFFSSLQQFVSDAGSSLTESARKLVQTSSRDSANAESDHDDLEQKPRLHLPLSPKSSGGSLGLAVEVTNGSNLRRNSSSRLFVPNNSNNTSGSQLASPGWAGRIPLTPSPTARSGEPLPPSNFFNVSNSRSSMNQENSGNSKSRAGSRKGRDKKDSTPSAVVMAREKSLKGIRERQKKAKDKICLHIVQVPEKWREIIVDTELSCASADNGFLEVYGRLPIDYQERVKAQQLMQRKNTVGSFDEFQDQQPPGPPREKSAGIEPAIDKICPEERYLLYKEVLYTITHKLGSHSPGPMGSHPVKIKIQLSNEEHRQRQCKLLKEELLSYAQKAFGVDNKEHKRLMEEVSDEKPPIVVLNVIVIEAKDLEAKDSDGFSDPYCMLGIRPGMLQNSGSSLGVHQTATRTASTPQHSPKRSSLRRSSLDTSSESGWMPRSPTKSPCRSPNKSPNSSNVEVNNSDQDEVTALPEAGGGGGGGIFNRLEKPRRSFRLSFKRKESSKKKKDSLGGQGGSNAQGQQLPQVNENPSPTGGDPTATLMPCGGTASSGGAMPAKYIRATTVKTNTLSPVWNERFRFDLDDQQTDFLHLDIWDHDDETSVFEAVSKLNEVKGMRGLGRYFKQVAQSARTGGQDDFLGSVNLAVRDIPSTGSDMWYKLEGRSSKSNIQGSIRLKVWLSTREDRGLSEEEDMYNEIRQQELLYATFLQHEIDTEWKTCPWKCSGELPEAARTILHQHMIQGDLTDLQVAALRWRALFKKAKEVRINFRLLFEALSVLESRWKNDGLSQYEEHLLAQSFAEFIEYGLLLVQKHRTLFPPTNKSAMEKFDYLLRCLTQLAEMKVFSRCCPRSKDLKTEISQAIKKGTADTFFSLYDPNEMEEFFEGSGCNSASKTSDILKIIVETIIFINNDLERGRDHYNTTFESIFKISYVSSVYGQYETLVSTELAPVIQKVCELDVITRELLRQFQPGSRRGSANMPNSENSDSFKAMITLKSSTNHLLALSLFEIALALKDFFAFRHLEVADDKRALAKTNSNNGVPKYLDWFANVFNVWLGLVAKKLPDRVERSMSLSDLVPANEFDEMFYLNSAREVTASIYQVKEFWRNLGWNNATNSKQLLAGLMEAICQSVTQYTDLSHKFLLEKTKGESGFFVTGKKIQYENIVVAVVNSLEHVLQYVSLIPDDLELDIPQTATFITSESSDNDSMKTEEAVNNSVEDANAMEDGDPVFGKLAKTLDYMDMVIYTILETLHGKLQDALRKHIFHLAWSPDSLPALDAMKPLVKYLAENLSPLNRCFLRGNYQRCLHVAWESVLTELKEHVDVSEILSEFFYAEGHGIDGPRLLTDNYKKLDLQFSLNGRSTETLIDMYHMERLQRMQLVENPIFGTLNVRVYFNHDCLIIEVISAKNVIPLDSNGLSDPFVVVELLPSRIFNCAEHQTNVHKNTLNPLFEESFEFPASLTQCSDPYAMIRFSVYDHDVLSYNDFAGETFLSLGSIPGVQGSSVDNFHGLKHVELPLMFQDNKDHPIFTTLESRTGDKIAQDFVKRQRQRILP